MRVSRAKLVTFSAVAAGVVVLGAAVVVAVAKKDRILERWYIYQLERADSKQDVEAAERAIAGLGEVGSETALFRFTDRASRISERMALTPLEKAGEMIIHRIGEARFFTFVTEYIRDSAQNARMRAHLSRAPFDMRYHLNQSREIIEAREIAIATLSELLHSEDEAASLAAAYSLVPLDEAQLDGLSNAAKETAKKEKQRAMERLRLQRRC